MYARLINLVAAILFFVTALRDWFLAGNAADFAP
jgi:hypothetical protein